MGKSKTRNIYNFSADLVTTGFDPQKIQNSNFRVSTKNKNVICLYFKYVYSLGTSFPGF